MKIVFDKLQTSKETIQVSFDGGTTWNSYVVSEIINDGIPLDENQEYDKIQIKGTSKVLSNLDVVKSIEIPESNNTKDEMFTHDGIRFYDDLVNVKIPESFIKIGNDAFYGCAGLENIEIPNSVTSIGNRTFRGCTSLTSIDLPENLKSIGVEAFYGCVGLASIDIPDGVTGITQSTFQNCTSLTNIDIPDSVTYIGFDAFQNCTSLTSIDLPKRLTSIWPCAFRGCTSLTSINLPESLTSIDYNVFDGCTSLKTINFKGTEEQWNAISKGNNWNKSCPSDMVINFDYQGE